MTVGYSGAEIAARLGISRRSVVDELRRFRSELRRVDEEAGRMEPIQHPRDEDGFAPINTEQGIDERLEAGVLTRRFPDPVAEHAVVPGYNAQRARST